MADYNLTSIPVVDEQERMLGVVTVDDVLEAMLPRGWRGASDCSARTEYDSRCDERSQRDSSMAVRVPPVMRRIRSATRGRPRLPARLNPRRARIFAFLGLLGPGLIAANAGNDAGGIATYSSVGAKYGYGLLWTIVLITISLALVQMLAARMGVVTGKGLAELVREEYGIRWSVFATSAVLIANLGICISDFVGIGAALGLAGIPAQVSRPDRRRRDLADHRARLLPLGRADLHLVHDPVLRLPDRRDPRPPRLGRSRQGARRPPAARQLRPSCCC